MPSAVLAFALATLREALRGPAPWLIAALVLSAVAAGLGLGIFALSSDPEAAGRLALESAMGTAALGTLWVLARTLDGDSRSGFCAAADQARGGPRARWLGRYAGALGTGLLAAVPAAGWGVVWAQSSVFSLVIASTCAAALAGAVALALHALRWGGVAVGLGSAALWVLGHLPWGAPGWGGATLGWLAGLLPPGVREGRPTPACLVATEGWLALAMARARAVGEGEGPEGEAAGGAP